MVRRMNDRTRVWSEERMDGRRERWMAGGKERRRRDGRRERVAGGKNDRRVKTVGGRMIGERMIGE